MRVMISADMEGITGVTCPADVKPGGPRWEQARHDLMSDVNAAVRGFLRGGATEICVNDAHADKRNLRLGELDERATAIIGTHKPLGMMQGLEEADAVAFVGYHTGAGRQGVLSHTYIGRTILAVTINGEAASEGRMNAMLAAEFGVPVVLVTGDDLTCQSAAGNRRREGLRRSLYRALPATRPHRRDDRTGGGPRGSPRFAAAAAKRAFRLASRFRCRASGGREHGDSGRRGGRRAQRFLYAPDHA